MFKTEPLTKIGQTGAERLAEIASKGRPSSWNPNPPERKTNRSGEGSEHAEQVALMRIVSFNLTKHPELKNLFAIPNGEKRHFSVANRLQAEGVKSGIPDLCLAVMRSIYGGLYIEMKRPAQRPKRGGRGGLSDDQDAWRIRLIEAGYRHAVCYTAEEAWREIEEYLHLEKSIHQASINQS